MFRTVTFWSVMGSRLPAKSHNSRFKWFQWLLTIVLVANEIQMLPRFIASKYYFRKYNLDCNTTYLLSTNQSIPLHKFHFAIASSTFDTNYCPNPFQNYHNYHKIHGGKYVCWINQATVLDNTSRFYLILQFKEGESLRQSYACETHRRFHSPSP